ncbi:acyltransferase family protein [Aquabacterium sp.]|uniref:acyltransferase family protein n=1 Tax=Aquabacterium sp. TaxID=1872578 RepID=UPI002B9CC588|nr:acyltransferase [Aquabacterium sp.]HSW04374.1 acyltransferase [Aquabacterium sp.]
MTVAASPSLAVTAAHTDAQTAHHERLPGLDLLRAVAVVWTMLFHSFLVGGLGEQWSWLSRYGWMGVDLFFVLSGFLIGAQVLAPLARGARFDAADFYLRRAFRILPAFWAVLALYLLWPDFREAAGMEPWWKFAGFFVNLSIDYGAHTAFSHAWSLCVEEHFYLVFPLLACLMLRWRSGPAFGALCIAVVLAGIGLRAGVWLHDDALQPARNWFVEDIYYPTWQRLDGLLAGVILAACKTFRPASWARLGERANLVLLAGALGMGLSFWLFRERTGLLANSIGWPVLSVALALLVVAGAQRGGLLGGRALPGAGALAAVSYSLYLIHKPVYGLVHTHLGAALQGRGTLAFVVYGAASLLAAVVLHRLVERPGLRLRGRLLAWRATAARSRPGSGSR